MIEVDASLLKVFVEVHRAMRSGMARTATVMDGLAITVLEVICPNATVSVHP